MKTRRKRLSAAEIDAHVATRIRKRRLVLGLTQRQLGNAIGVTARQVYKYEQGLNRVSVGTLYAIAQALDVSVTYLFKGIGEAARVEKPYVPLLTETTLHFSAIQNERHQEAFCQLVRVLAYDEPVSPPDVRQASTTEIASAIPERLLDLTPV